MERDNILARAAVARSIATFVTDSIDELIVLLANPDGKKTEKELVNALVDALDNSGHLSRCLEVIEKGLEDIDPQELLTGEPDYDEIIDDGASEAADSADDAG